LLDSLPRPGAPQTRRILFASLIGTTIEFFDFYIYATAAVLVFPRLFFPKGDPATALLQSFATFALAFFARPVGSALFGHFGDRIGRKATLVTALLTMGVSTVCIGLLPTYASIGALADWGRAWDWAASGAAPCCWRRKTLPRGSRPGTEAFRNSVRRSDFCVPPACSC
jgi:MFS family permease